MQDLSGQRFNYLTVSTDYERRTGGIYWRAVCDCGQERWIRAWLLVTGKRKSCGCMKGALCAKTSTTHGRAKLATRSRAYRVWDAMKYRCHTPTSQSYHRYGGRGITVCDRWRYSFEAFLEDMGEPPEGASIDRIDNSLGYSPENCRWADAKQQARNRRTNRLTEADAARIREAPASVRTADLARELGVSRTLVGYARHGDTWT